ncbi:hypothetical protein [Microbacterium lacticum]|uniref:hypothetical protein n=1 Tax=Microbacterium lacticum TaxID=33885 RepID=UPI00242ECF0B|nr:hypothetical protein [Microbacterium lacticum]
MADHTALEHFLADDESLVLIIAALGEYRSLLRDNQETAVSDAEHAYFIRLIAMVDGILCSLGAEDSKKR